MITRIEEQKREEFYITDPEEYKIYAQLVREQEPICVAYDCAMIEFVENDGNGKDMLLNGGVTSDGFNMPMAYECYVGHGIVNENDKRETMYNMYEICLYPDTCGVEIYKVLKKACTVDVLR